MEMMPYQPHHDSPEAAPTTTRGTVPMREWVRPAGIFVDHDRLQRGDEASVTVPTDWRKGLPTLTGTRLTLRELRHEDAASLFAHVTTEEVARFISPPPTSVAGFERFIEWAHERRAQGRYACFAVVPEGQTQAVGMFQAHILDASRGIAEWGFVLGSGHWGTGLFLDGARLTLRFVFEAMGLRRLDAQACLANGRGTGALRKVGAVRERVLPGSFTRHGEVLDQALWTILREDWAWTTSSSEGGAVQ